MNKGLKRAIFIIVGAVAGYLYYRYVGCAGGNCAITSSPVISTLYGGILGFLVFNIFSGGCCCAGDSCNTDYSENKKE